jgi:hypothetical protein
MEYHLPYEMKKYFMAKYSKKVFDKVEDVMQEEKLTSGRSGKKVTSRKLSEAREEGAKVPKKTSAKKTSSKRTTVKSKDTASRSSL